MDLMIQRSSKRRTGRALTSRNTVRLAVVDALGMASGFLFALFALGSVREILGEEKYLEYCNRKVYDAIGVDMRRMINGANK